MATIRIDNWLFFFLACAGGGGEASLQRGV